MTPGKHVVSGATSGAFLPYCNWNGSVTVLTANRWQRNALAADSMYRTDRINQ